MVLVNSQRCHTFNPISFDVLYSVLPVCQVNARTASSVSSAASPTSWCSPEGYVDSRSYAPHSVWALLAFWFKQTLLQVIHSSSCDVLRFMCFQHGNRPDVLSMICIHIFSNYIHLGCCSARSGLGGGAKGCFADARVGVLVYGLFYMDNCLSLSPSL